MFFSYRKLCLVGVIVFSDIFQRILIAIYSQSAPRSKTDEGQFTSDAFTGELIEGITISMDGRGRALDNIFIERLWRTVKYEEVYLKQHDSIQSLLMGLTDYFVFYNEERYHQSLDHKTSSVVYQTATGGGAKIVDKFNGTTETAIPILKNWDSAIQLEHEQGSILN